MSKRSLKIFSETTFFIAIHKNGDVFFKEEWKQRVKSEPEKDTENQLISPIDPLFKCLKEVRLKAERVKELI